MTSSHQFTEHTDLNLFYRPTARLNRRVFKKLIRLPKTVVSVYKLSHTGSKLDYSTDFRVVRLSVSINLNFNTSVEQRFSS